MATLYVYPTTVFIEGTNYSEGRGTKYPFQQIGAPWVDAEVLAKALNDKKLAGIYFEPIRFTPKTIPGMAEDPKHKNQVCCGVFVHLYDAPKAQQIEIAQTILKVLFSLYPQQSKWLKWGKPFGIDLLVGGDEWRKNIDLGLVNNVGLG